MIKSYTESHLFIGRTPQELLKEPKTSSPSSKTHETVAMHDNDFILIKYCTIGIEMALSSDFPNSTQKYEEKTE